MEETKEIVITYETLFELLRREKDREALQKLNPTFFEDVIKYINEKKGSIAESAEKSSPSDKEKIEKQLQNIKKIIRELYEKREKKILLLSIDKSRTASVIDSSALLKEEEQIFIRMTCILDQGRRQILDPLLEGNLPVVTEIINEPLATAPEKKPEHEKETKLVRFLHPVPRFLGKELEEYGPFEEEDVASLPTEIANVLLTKGRAEEINEY